MPTKTSTKTAAKTAAKTETKTAALLVAEKAAVAQPVPPLNQPVNAAAPINRQDAARLKTEAKAERAASKEIVGELKDSDTQNVIVKEIAREVRQEQPEVAAGLTDAEIEAIIEPVVKEKTAENLEQRSTVPAMVTKIKTETKTRFKGLVAAHNDKKTKSGALDAAREEIITGAESPLGASPEAQAMVGDDSNENSPAVLKAVEKERQRLEDQRSGKINEPAEMTVGRAYHVQRKTDPTTERSEPAENFLGRLLQSSKGGKITFTVTSGGRETGQREINAADYEINEVDSLRAYELGLVL